MEYTSTGMVTEDRWTSERWGVGCSSLHRILLWYAETHLIYATALHSAILNPNTYKQLPIPPPPPTQCLTSKTFRLPPLDGSMTVPEMFDWHLKNSPEHPLFIYSDDDGNTTTIKWADAVKAVHRAGRLLQARLNIYSSGPKNVPFVAMLANADTITYFTAIAGAQRAGFAPFPLSVRNSAAAVAHLLTKTGAPYLVLGRDQSMQELAANAFQIMQQSGTRLPLTVEMPLFEDLYVPGAPLELLPPLKLDQDDPIVVMHSSGSTAFPKPIVWSQNRFIQLGLAPYFGERDLTGYRFAAHCTPMFHAMGLINIAFVACVGLTITAFKPQFPPRMLTEDAMVKAVEHTQSDILICVPSFVETWVKNPEHIRILRKTGGIMFGGGPLSKEAGDEMVGKGVKLFSLYGASETGVMCCFLPKDTGKDWEYIYFTRNVNTHLVPQENGNVELVLLPNAYQCPSIMNCEIDGKGAYNTNDVLAPHPTKPGYWKIFGRSDDQIMHSTGEKTNPGPLEHILQQDPHVQSALMFGRGRFNAGVLIEPKEQYKFDPADQAKLVAFRNAIWPTVEKMNDYAPQHSRIFKEMITVSAPEKPFTYTAKNTPRRHAIIREYEPEIEALYAAVDESTQADLVPPPSWNAASAKAFVRAVVTRVLDHDLADTDDLFHSGCDRHVATWIRNSLLHALRDTTTINTRTIPNNFVYRYPTVAKLANFVSGLASSDYGDEEDFGDDEAVEAMHRMVEKYSRNFPTHEAKAAVPQKDVVLLTGTTGGLGASILADLITSPEVGRVYAMNRKGAEPILPRQRAVLKDRGLDADAILDSTKVVLLETSLGDHLGLPLDVIEELRSSLTHIIHNAWPVNFNLSLDTFEPSVRAVRQLVDLALSSPHRKPPTLVFISSIGVFRHLDLSKPVAEGPIEAPRRRRFGL
ncbi:hypothetical protein NM688_g7469 [Phlebia brevispora]|uniref:Uncharacterized protein n=1 Tax=Phlebia brevispora TaxID=194682 RepID=A0ACC1S5E4_9APHY|nr:hypothetical protein NM688_g7469 [Phlebia brevispora]